MQTSAYPELEFSFERQGETEFRVILRHRDPDAGVEPSPTRGVVKIDFKQFEAPALLNDSVAYGLELGKALFADADVRARFEKAYDDAAERRLRVRLCVDPKSLKLHRLRWETLRLPDREDPTLAKSWLIGDQRILFSRHLFSDDNHNFRLRPKAELQPLIAVSGPSDLADNLRVDVPEEMARATKGLEGLKAPKLMPSDGGPVTLNALIEAIREGVDVLYLVCHGAIVADEPRLLLQKEDGTRDNVSGVRLIEAFKGLAQLPRLVVLVSCQSAKMAYVGARESAALAAIGPRLAEIGVPAVVAMQDDFDMKSAEKFIPALFKSLAVDGQIDKAVADARGLVPAAAGDAWVPVLFTRLLEGRLWFDKGFTPLPGGADSGLGTLVNQLRRSECVPVLGSGVLEPYLGSTRSVARSLADANDCPRVLAGQDDLPQILQILKIIKPKGAPREQLLGRWTAAVRDWFARRNGAVPAVPAGSPEAVLDSLLSAAGKIERDANPFEPHRYLANLKAVRTFVSTNPDGLLAQALVEAGSTPTRLVYQWESRLLKKGAALKSLGGPAKAEEPTVEKPVVCQMFGHLGDVRSLVLAEDDYFEFLTTAAAMRQMKRDTKSNDNDSSDFHQTVLDGTFAESAFLFLGFRLTDWDFRVFLRYLLDQHGKALREDVLHLAVQIDPEQGTRAEAEQTRAYVCNLLGGLGKVTIFWGGVEDFLRELDEAWRK